VLKRLPRCPVAGISLDGLVRSMVTEHDHQCLEPVELVSSNVSIGELGRTGFEHDKVGRDHGKGAQTIRSVGAAARCLYEKLFLGVLHLWSSTGGTWSRWFLCFFLRFGDPHTGSFLGRQRQTRRGLAILDSAWKMQTQKVGVTLRALLERAQGLPSRTAVPPAPCHGGL